MKKKPDKIIDIWTKVSNPLRYLTNTSIENLLNSARFGNDIRLQVAYFEIERNTPIFSACINKRIAGVQNRSWDIVPDDDSEDSMNQAKFVKSVFDKSDSMVEDNLTDAIRHLTLGTFRGRSAVKPFVVDGKLIFKKLDNWNFIRYNNKNYWNPNSDMVNVEDESLFEKQGIVELPNDEICYVIDDKPLDWIGMTIYLRQLIGEETWARFIEKQGIPQVIITAPDGTPETDLEKWNYRAQAIYEGGSGCLPSGATVEEITGARSQDPFTNFITHQSEMFCILAVGGTMSTLGGTQGASGAGMGSDLANNQNDQFQSLINYDCKRIQNAMQVAVSKVVKEMLNTENVKCHFEYVERDDTTPQEYLDMALKIRDLGMKIDPIKFKEMTKLQWIDTDSWSPDVSTGWTRNDALEVKKEREEEE